MSSAICSTTRGRRDRRLSSRRLASAYEQLADYHLRRLGRWSAKGKGIPRALVALDADLATRYSNAFDRLFAHADAMPVIALGEALLAPAGGPLFEGYRATAPPTWRTPR